MQPYSSSLLQRCQQSLWISVPNVICFSIRFSSIELSPETCLISGYHACCLGIFPSNSSLTLSLSYQVSTHLQLVYLNGISSCLTWFRRFPQYNQLHPAFGHSHSPKLRSSDISLSIFCTIRLQFFLWWKHAESSTNNNMIRVKLCYPNFILQSIHKYWIHYSNYKSHRTMKSVFFSKFFHDENIANIQTAFSM